jgi:hypothetical protein
MIRNKSNLDGFLEVETAHVDIKNPGGMVGEIDFKNRLMYSSAAQKNKGNMYPAIVIKTICIGTLKRMFESQSELERYYSCNNRFAHASKYQMKTLSIQG